MVIRGYKTQGIFFDISESFDKLRNEALVFKLKQNETSEDLLNILEKFLKNRKLKATLIGQTCNYKNIHADYILRS